MVPVYGRTVTLEFSDHYVECLQTFESTFSVLMVDCHLLPEDQTEENSIPLWLTRLREALRDVDVIGQLADTRYIVLLPQTRKRAAEAVRQNAVTALGPQSPFSLTVVEISKPAQLTQIVAGRNTLARTA